jgi:thiamine kinase-like enzyme
MPNPEKDQRFHAELDMTVLRSEFAALKAALLALGSPTVFTHNDLLCKNILHDAEHGEYWDTL